MTSTWIDRVHGTSGFLDGIRRFNRLRRNSPSLAHRAALDEATDALLDRPSTRLAVYGSLAPGEVNDHVLASLEGRWKDGVVRGVVHEGGWGTGHGFPGLVWDVEGPPIGVRVFHSDELCHHWDRLDAFEGPDYDRLLVPVEGLEGGVRICNVYAVAGTGVPEC